MNDNPFFTHEEPVPAEECPPHELPVDPPVREGIPPVAEQPAPVPSGETVTYDRPVTEPATPQEPTPRPEGQYGRTPYYGRPPYGAAQPSAPAGQQIYYGRPTEPYYGRPSYGQDPASPVGGYGQPPRPPYGNGQNGYPYGGSPYGAVPPTQPPADPKPKKKGPNWLLALLIAGCILIGSVSGVLIANLGDRSHGDEEPTVSDATRPTKGDRPAETERPTQPPRETQPLATANGEQMTLNQIYTANVPAIVSITNEFTQSVFGQTSTATSAGSGFIITSDGEILTNYHVVEGAEQLTVTLYDGREYPATLIGYEAESDVALIKIEAQGLPVCAIGNSDHVFVGEQIAAIGNPMGELNYTMTVGYVSAVDRFVKTDGTPINMIQVDAAINPGNSGGPVFNLYGEVVGIATAKYSGTISGGATLEGLGFAIPINDVVEILNDLRVNGKVPDRAYMGVMVSMLPLDEETYGLDRGVFVQSVDEGGSAYKAGVRANDIILKIGDVELEAYENLQQTLRKYRAGDETTITVYRNGETITMPIIFDAKPENTDPVTQPVPSEAPTEPETTEFPWGDIPWEDFPWEDFVG